MKSPIFSCKISVVKYVFTLLIAHFIASPLIGQKSVSEADTGRMVWGHADFKGYDRAGMCNRTLDEVVRQYSRIYVKDTALEPIRGNRDFTPKLPAEAIETVRKCIAHLDMDDQTNDQLWAIARIYMVIGEAQKSRDIAEKAIATGINRNEKLEMMLLVMEMYLNYNADYLPHVRYFADLIRSQEPSSNVYNFHVDFLMSTYHYIVYQPDSVILYSNRAIETLKKMTREEMDSVSAFEPFSHQMSIANINGDIRLEEEVIEHATKLISGWRDGLGQRMIMGASRGLDIKKTVYNKKINVLESAMWENYDGIPRPLIGKPSLFITVNQNCSAACYSRLNAIRRLKRTFGDSLDIVLITATMGYGPGTGPLSPKEEAKVAARFFKEFHDLPYTLLVDESPTHKMDDGRIVRDRSPIIQMLEELNNSNAIITDADGRIQWAGVLRNERYMRSVTAVIDRALDKIRK